MKCFTCDKIGSKHSDDKHTCGICREVLKIDLVRRVLELDPVYLSESNRHKTGRKPKLTATERHDIAQAYKDGAASLGALAKKYKMSKSAIFNIVHKD